MLNLHTAYQASAATAVFLVAIGSVIWAVTIFDYVKEWLAQNRRNR